MKDLSNENIVHIKKNGIEYLQFRKLLEYNNALEHCFTLKIGDLDFGATNLFKENKDVHMNNYKKICDVLNLDYKNIVRPKQTHTDIIKKVEKDNLGIFPTYLNNVDGLITNLPNQILSLTYADCISLYFYDPQKNVIANVHSGWKGTLQMIAKNAVEKMATDFLCDVKDIICCIGPSICKKHFEVDEDVAKMFYDKFKYLPKIDDIITETRNKGKYGVDTVLINRQVLEMLELSPHHIIESNICTACNSDCIYSYRGSNGASRKKHVFNYFKKLIYMVL